MNEICRVRHGLTSEEKKVEMARREEREKERESVDRQTDRQIERNQEIRKEEKGF